MPLYLSILSNAGGSGKTTLSVHLAYSMSQLGFSVALIDLDPQGSLGLFCGLPPAEATQTTSAVLDDNFTGNYPFIPCWSQYTDKVEVCRGGLILAKSTQEISLHPRGSYLLADKLQDYPLSYDLVIFDCPATLGPLPLVAVAASSHLLVPVQLQPKSIQGSAKLLEWLYAMQKQLRLNPAPQILGFVPNQYDHTRAAQRQILDQLPRKLSSMNINCFPPVRDSAEFVNASAAGLPLHLFRPAHPATKEFKAIASAVQKLLQKPE